MNIIFLGPPGAGKGTHAQILVKQLGIPQISTGEILRGAIRAQTETGLKAKSYIDAGQLVPDEVVIQIVKERLAEKDCENGYILDGFPRTVHQAEELEKFAEIDVALNLSIADEVIIRRMSARRVCPKCGGTYSTAMLNGSTVCPMCGETVIQRKDDLPETVLSRLEVYRDQTEPLIGFYDGRDLLKTIECTGTLEENHAKVLKALGKENLPL